MSSTRNENKPLEIQKKNVLFCHTATMDLCPRKTGVLSTTSRKVYRHSTPHRLRNRTLVSQKKLNSQSIFFHGAVRRITGEAQDSSVVWELSPLMYLENQTVGKILSEDFDCNTASSSKREREGSSLGSKFFLQSDKIWTVP
jgi:hypothetical protein